MILAIRGLEVIYERPKPTSQVKPVFMYETRRMMLIEEYRQLTSAVARRASQYTTVQSLLISSSLVAVSIVFSGQSIEDTVKPAFLIASILLVVLACAFAITTTAIDSMFWNRIHKIEGEVGIEVGHRLLYETVIKRTIAFRLRRLIWPAIFSSLLTFYFYLLYIGAPF